MSNLFKKGFASLALASAMASSVFAGDAAYIDVKVNYLSGTGKAVLGYESWDSDTEKYKVGAKKDLVELYIRVLDKEGNLADKDSVSDVLIPMILTRSGSTKNVDNLRNDISVGNEIGETDTATHSIVRSVVTNKNAARYTLDYTNQNSAKLVDKLIIKAGNLKKSFDVQLDTIDATSLLVRATTKNSIDATFGGMGSYLNDEFSDIRLLGDSSLVPTTSGTTTVASDGNLSGQSHSIPQITAGDTIPLRIFASTGPNGASSGGRFTMAPNLEGKKIVVVAVGDYNLNGNASVYLGQTELTMENGIASGNMMINHGLPERITTLIDAAAGHVGFDVSQKFGGLGVTFIAYAKDKSTINNHSPVSLSGGVLKLSSLGIEGNNSNTDAIKVRSGVAAGFRGGNFDGNFSKNTSGNTASNLWTGNKTDVFVPNSAGILTEDINRTISVTVVDKLGNPAILATSIATTLVLDAKFTVNGNSQDDGNDFAKDAKFDFNISNNSGMVTAGYNGLTTAIIVIRDGKKNIALSSEVTAKYTGQSLAGLTPFKFNVHTIDLVGKTPNDTVGDLRSFVKELNVSNSSSSKIIYAEKASKDDYANMKLIIRVVEVKKGNDNNQTVKLSVKAINNKGEVDTGLFVGGNGFVGVQATKENGGTNVELNSTSVNVIHISSEAAEAKQVIATIHFSEVNGTDNKNLYAGIVGTTTTFILKANGKGDDNNTYGRNIDAYVATTTTSDNAKDFVTSTGTAGKQGTVGKTVIDFDFSGTLVDQFAGKAVATITFISGTDEDNNSLKAGIVGKPFVSTSTIEASANTRVVKAIIPESKRLSVALYGAYDMDSSDDAVKVNSDSNKTVYNIQSISINGFTTEASGEGNATIVYTSRNSNKLTEAIDIDVRKDNNVTVVVGDESLAAKVKIAELGNIAVGIGTGKDTKNISSLPPGLVADSSFGTKPIKTKKLVPVSTNTYYSLFGKATNLEIQDAYGNQADIGQILLEKNYALSASDTECVEVAMAKGFDSAKPAYIYFKPCAAGKEIDLIVSVSGNEEVKNTITFTNIVKKLENTKFNVSLNVGDPDYNIVNNDVVVKVTPDGGTERSDTTLTVTSDNKDAKVKVVPVDLLIGREFGDLTGSGTTLKATINAKGSYFVITSDKPGKITVKADATIPSSESVSGDDVAITGTTSFTMVSVDTSAPTVTATSTSGSITVTVKDDGLDAEATTVVIHDMSGKTKIADAKHTGNGVYVASSLKQGVYSVDVYAMDLSGNIHKQIIVVNVGTSSATLEDALVANGSYVIDGTFSAHDFADIDGAFDWVYTQGETMYQLNAKDSKDASPFKWGKVTDITPSKKNAWSMIKLTGSTGSPDAEGSYGWVLVNANGDTFKLAGANDDGTFKFSDPLYVKGTITGSNISFAKR